MSTGFEVGNVVISKSGRDKGVFFVVVEICEGFVYLADGKLRKLEKPKKKNQKHLQRTNMFLKIDEITGNRMLNKMLLELKSSKKRS